MSSPGNAARSVPRQIAALAGWLLVSFLPGIVGAIASANAASFYAQLVSPQWAPPAWLFAPVWNFLYLCMGVAAWLVWRARGFAGARTALSLFLIQLVLNGLWSWLFFAWHRGALSLAGVLCLWLLIAATLIAFWRIKPAAGLLLLPYLLWVGFATALNFTLWRLNPQLLT